MLKLKHYTNYKELKQSSNTNTAIQQTNPATQRELKNFIDLLRNSSMTVQKLRKKKSTR